MNSDLRERFAELHVPGNPVLLYNIWDVGSAKAVANGGRSALATGSHSLAEANGFPDGEQIPFNLFLDCVRRIVEGGGRCRSRPTSKAASRSTRRGWRTMRATSPRPAPSAAISRIRKSAGRACTRSSSRRRRVAAVVESGLWVNARTDLFLRKLIAGENPNDRSLLGEALERAHAYAEAGAHSFFVPGLSDLELIADICAASPLPVNVIKPADHDIAALAEGRRRADQLGPRPWGWAMDRLTEEAAALYR